MESSLNQSENEDIAEDKNLTVSQSSANFSSVSEVYEDPVLTEDGDETSQSDDKYVSCLETLDNSCPLKAVPDAPVEEIQPLIPENKENCETNCDDNIDCNIDDALDEG